MIDTPDVDDGLGTRRHSTREIDPILRTDEDEGIRESDGRDEEKGHVDLWVNLLEFPADDRRSLSNSAQYQNSGLLSTGYGRDNHIMPVI